MIITRISSAIGILIQLLEIAYAEIYPNIRASLNGILKF